MPKSWHDEGFREKEGSRPGAFGVVTVLTISAVKQVQTCPQAVFLGERAQRPKACFHAEGITSPQSSSREAGFNFTSLYCFD